MTTTEITHIKRDSDCYGNKKDHSVRNNWERERRGGGGGIVPMPLLGVDGWGQGYPTIPSASLLLCNINDSILTHWHCEENHRTVWCKHWWSELTAWEPVRGGPDVIAWHGVSPSTKECQHENGTEFARQTLPLLHTAKSTDKDHVGRQLAVAKHCVGIMKHYTQPCC